MLSSAEPDGRDVGAMARVVLALIAAEEGRCSAWEPLDPPALDLLFADAERLAATVPVALARLCVQLVEHPHPAMRERVTRPLRLVSTTCPAESAVGLWRLSRDASRKVRVAAAAALRELDGACG
jgi:hypothetical protein